MKANVEHYVKGAPWIAEYDHGYRPIRVRPRGSTLTVAIVDPASDFYRDGLGDALEHARVIAAAPELLDAARALDGLCNRLESLVRGYAGQQSETARIEASAVLAQFYADMNSEVGPARAAIAKAEGRF